MQPDKASTTQLLYRVSNVMKMLDVSRSTLYRMVDRGELELIHLTPTSSRITAASVHRLAEGRTTTKPQC